MSVCGLQLIKNSGVRVCSGSMEIFLKFPHTYLNIGKLHFWDDKRKYLLKHSANNVKSVFIFTVVLFYLSFLSTFNRIQPGPL